MEIRVDAPLFSFISVWPWEEGRKVCLLHPPLLLSPTYLLYSGHMSPCGIMVLFSWLTSYNDHFFCEVFLRAAGVPDRTGYVSEPREAVTAGGVIPRMRMPGWGRGLTQGSSPLAPSTKSTLVLPTAGAEPSGDGETYETALCTCCISLLENLCLVGVLCCSNPHFIDFISSLDLPYGETEVQIPAYPQCHLVHHALV